MTRHWLAAAVLSASSLVAAQPASEPTPAAPVATAAEPTEDGVAETEGAPVEPTPEPPPAEDTGEETIEIVDRKPPGAHTEVGKEALERWELDDLHKVLGGTAGVYVRDEDGYGLRPNIGMRGASADRSSRITMMEDGVLSGPAPYSAPAAYYVPLVTRMSRLEVTKGPSAIRFGPATIGGAIDMISEPFPAARAGYVDVAGGGDRYGKLHARAAERRERWGVMAEYVKLRSDGFKDLDGGGSTGFDKDDVQLTGRLMSKPTDETYHRLDLRVGYGREMSNETYTGLSNSDFAVAPQRRYRASMLDQMNWDHWKLRATHVVELSPKTKLQTDAYRHKFRRAWGKVDGFVGKRDFYGLLANPMAGANAIYYAILKGEQDTTAPEEQLILGTNDRGFTSQGIQTQLATKQTTGPLAHEVHAGVRIHFDRADRRRLEDGYEMLGGELVRSSRPRDIVLDSRAETIAFAVFAEDKVSYKRLDLTAGTRVELIDIRFADWLTMGQAGGDYAVVIPGGGAEYHITDEASVIAGVHRGFVPTAPTASASVRPESSVNYEAGGRWRDNRIEADVIGFYSDYSNIKGTSEANEGEEYDGGRVRVFGAEVQAAAELPVTKQIAAPLSLAYTFTQSRFQRSFMSRQPGWGEVEAGDELPYLPAHQLAVTAGAKRETWEASATAHWRSASRDEAGQGAILDATRVSSLFTIDLAAHARLKPWAEIYATCTNLLDEQVIVARRPFGARPNPPRMITVGYKARF